MTTTARTGEGMIDADGIATHYHEGGSGDPVLLLHGSGPGVSAWANWQHTLPSLAERFHVLAPDSVGFGATDRPDNVRYSLATWIDQAWAFLDAHGIQRTSVVGNSLGGRIALGMAAQHPDRIDRMVLMGSPGPGMAVTEGLQALRSYEPSYDAMRRLLLDYFAVDPTIITEELIQIRYEASIAPGAYETYRAMFFDPRHGGNDLGITEDEVSSIHTPSLVVHGREDKVVPVEVGLTLSRLLPDADLHVFANCGHWTQIERADMFNALVGDFLKRPNTV